jgi:hypothetical protein
MAIDARFVHCTVLMVPPLVMRSSMWRLSRSLRPGLEPFTRLMAKVLMPSCTWPQLIVASELAQSIGLALCTQWVQQLEGGR